MTDARDKILDAADDLFGEIGFDAATTREIAQRSGVNKALIHYHFQSKERLLENLLERYYDALFVLCAQSFAADGSPREKLLRLLDVYSDFLSANLNFSRIVQREASGGKHMELIQKRMLPIFDLGAKFLHAGYPATKKGAMTADHLMVSFYGMIVGYFTFSGILGRLRQADPLDKKNLSRRKKHLTAMAEIILDSLETGGR
jgi:TetR/AcrR family transcriptional regulator